MAVLMQINRIEKAYGVQVLLSGATASFGEGQRIGVIGRNGAGKSTLCRILAGKEEADGGEVIRNANLRLAYLEQHDPFLKDETVLEYLMRDSGREEWECAGTAARFHIKDALLERHVLSLPGGYQTRVKLTSMLLRDPNFLILDEPSNYLDLSTLILLENFLQDFNGGYLIVSHDREFLKRTCDATLEVDNGQVSLYPGNIEEYFEFKEEQMRQVMAYNRTVEKKKQQLQDFVDRFRAKASTASRAKSKMKQMEKLSTIEIAHSTHEVRIRIPEVESKAGVALDCQSLDIGYPEKKVASQIDITIDRGEHVALLGDNGQGKSTFLKTVASSIQPLHGSFKWTPSLRLGYYAQHVFQTLHPEDDVFSHLQREAAEGVTRQQVLDMAGSFLFRGDDVKKKISVLSGGERARACLAGLLLSRCHVLLLDEPTNHLDFETVEALGEALRAYTGTVIFISHDRTFVNLIATNILHIQDGVLKRYPGTYEDYVYHLEMEARGEQAGGEDHRRKEPRHEKRRSHGESPSRGRHAKKERQKLKAEMTKLKAKIHKAETRIHNLTQERDSILQQMADNPFLGSKEKKEKLKVVSDHLEDEEKQWLELNEQMEKLQAGNQP